MGSVWLFILVLTFGVYCFDAANSGPELYHFEYSRIQETDQAWKCWTEGYRPPKATSNKLHEAGNRTADEVQRILNFDQSSSVLFMCSSNSENGNLRTEFRIERNRLIRLVVDNAGLEKLELAFAERDNDCRLADLSVPRNRLKDLPAGVERLTALRKLDFSYNLLDHFNLGRLTNAKGLKTLLLSHNRLESFQAPSTVTFGSLQKLDLSNNRLRTLDSTYWNMAQLDTFHVDNNRRLATIDGWTRSRFPLVKGFDPMGTNNWNQTWLKSVQ